ncbi:MAG TPA: Crp/Fnr family transcriptional regulator, partial [Anaerolineales bacterium]|nr:Crp/Fnr family transcriptional regulator [Anaerolineales bacterium]
LDAAQLNRIKLAMPFLQRADAFLINELKQHAQFAKISAGHDIFVDGDRVDGIALLLSGVVRVYKIGETGREITLYRFGLGESCILSANAIMSDKSFPAIATVEEDAEAVMIPAEVFREWVNKYEPWREFVFGLLSERLSTVMTVVDEVVFKRMDRRVASFLLNQAEVQNPMRVTHQEIAAELGSSREVISRILEDFSREGLINAGRGTIEAMDFEGLKSRSVM